MQFSNMCENNCVYSFGLSLVLVGSLLLVIFCSELIPDYDYSKSMTEVTCAVTNSAIVANVCCESTVTTVGACGEDYIYPCAVVTATINNGQQEVTLFNDFTSATRSGKIAYCSYFHCDGSSYTDRLTDVQSFLSSYGEAGTSHKCYYANKEGSGHTSTLSRVSSGQLTPALVIPILILISGGIIVIVQIIVDKKKAKSSSNVEAVPPSAENLKKGDEFDDESDIETIEMHTASTLTTNLSAKSSLAATPKSNSPIKHPHSPTENY